MKRTLSLIVLLLLLPAAKAVWAQGQPPAAKQPTEQEPSFSAERPGFTNGTDTVPPGHYQLELGLTYSNGSGWQTRLGDGAQVRLPITDHLEGRLGIPAYVWQSQEGGGVTSGFNDSGLSLKWRFLDGTPRRPSLALILGTNLPTGSKDIDTHFLEPQTSLQAAYGLSDKWNLSGSATYLDARDGDQHFDQYGASANLGYAATDAVGVFGEVFRLSATGAGQSGANYLDGGITYLIGNRTQIDLNSGVGLSGSTRHSYFVGTGIAQRW
jgi:hypothetical protein